MFLNRKMPKLWRLHTAGVTCSIHVPPTNKIKHLRHLRVAFCFAVPEKCRKPVLCVADNVPRFAGAPALRNARGACCWRATAGLMEVISLTASGTARSDGEASPVAMRPVPCCPLPTRWLNTSLAGSLQPYRSEYSSKIPGWTRGARKVLAQSRTSGRPVELTLFTLLSPFGFLLQRADCLLQ